MAALQTSLWSANIDLNRAYLDWKYERNPYTPNPLIYVVLHDEKLVGMRGYLGARWQYDGEFIDIPCACDLVLHPDHRDKGIVRKLLVESQAELGVTGYPYLFNLSGGSPLTHLVQLALGWKAIGSLDICTRLDAKARVARYARGAVDRLRGRRATPPIESHASPPAVEVHSPWAAFDARVAHHPRRGVRVALAMDSVDDLAAVVARKPADGRIQHVRDEQWFRWRLQNPLNSYRCLFHGAEADGYLLLTASTIHPGAVGRIADLEAPSPEIAADLIDAAIAWGRFRRLHVWAVSLADRVRQVLYSRGFRNLEPNASFAQPSRSVMITATAPTPSWTLGTRPLLETSSWDLRQLYSDGA